MGEVGQHLATGRMLLPEDQLVLGTLGRPPMGDVALQSAQQPIRVTTGMQPLQFFKQGRGANARRPLQDRHDLGAPHVLEGIDPGPVLSGEPLARQYAPPFSMRRAVLSLKPARADAIAWLDPSLRSSMNRLTWRSVMCPPGIQSPLREEVESGSSPTGHPNRRQALTLIVVAQRGQHLDRHAESDSHAGHRNEFGPAGSDRGGSAWPNALAP